MISLILFTLGTAALSVFLDFCMEKGNIFRWWYSFITYWLYVMPKKGYVYKYRNGHIPKYWSNSHPSYYKKIKLPSFIKHLYKPLGGCIYCFGTWVFIVLFLCWSSQNSYSIHTFVSLFLGIGLNYIWIKILNKI